MSESLPPTPARPAAAAPSRPDGARDKRRRILLAARDICHSRGFEGTRMEAIAALAGVSKGTLYNFFASKEQLFTDMLLQGYAEYRALLPDVTDPRLDAEERLAALIESLVANFDSTARHILVTHQAWSVSLRAADTRDHVFAALQRFYSDFQSMLEEIMRAGVDSGQFEADLDVPTVASAWIGAYDGMLYRAGFADDAMRVVCGPDGARRTFEWVRAQIRAGVVAGSADRSESEQETSA
jgi:AcrR family transcriptional regulator